MKRGEPRGPPIARQPVPVDARELLTRRDEIAVLAKRALAGVGGRHTLPHQLTHSLLDVKSNLVVDIATNRARGFGQREQPAEAGEANAGLHVAPC